MCTVWSSSLGLKVHQWRHSNKNLRYWILLPHPKKNLSFVSSPIYSSTSNDSSSSFKQPHLGYDPSEDLFGLSADPQPRKVASAASRPRSWFGPNGLYIRELPCPSCRGRGYTQCPECGIERSRPDCSLCNGKGIVTCNQCVGDCVIWEESIDEQPWEKARSVSPLKVTEDDEVDKLDIKLDSLNARTGIISNRMKIIHRDPMLHAQRVAAIKKTKGTAAARKHASEVMKNYFSDPENRHKRSISMKGIKFYCRNCGGEGHRINYCPEVEVSAGDRRFRCRLCGEKGHNRRTCPISKKSNEKRSVVRRTNHCKICGLTGHNRRTCPQLAQVQSDADADVVSEGQIVEKRKYACGLCREKGHNRRNCPHKK